MNSLRSHRRVGFTLVEIMVVVALIAVLASLAIPYILRARKRSQATAVITELRQIDSAVDQYGAENASQSGTPVPAAMWMRCLKPVDAAFWKSFQRGN